MSRRDDIQNLILKSNRRLQKLREKRAVQGLNAEPELLIEIEDLEAEIEALEMELDSLLEVDDSPHLPQLTGTAETKPRQEGSRKGGIHFGDNTQVQGDVFTGSKQVVNTSGGHYYAGDINTGGGGLAGGNQITYGGSDTEGIAKVFAELYQALAQKPDTMQKQIAKQALKTLEEEAKKSDQTDEGKVKQALEVILAMLPDIGEVVINTFINPIQGISTVFQKIAKKYADST